LTSTATDAGISGGKPDGGHLPIPQSAGT
jgi:hypothetical protein